MNINKILLLGFNKEQIKDLNNSFGDKFFLNSIDSAKKFSAIVAITRKSFEENITKIISNNIDWIHLPGAGIEKYSYLKKYNNIIFTNGKIIQGPEVADHAIGLILNFTRNLYQISQNISLSKMDRPIELRNKKVLIIGLGGIGINVAERLKAFGAKIDGISNDLVPIVSFIDNIYLSRNINEIAKNYDIIVCAAPLTKKTKDMLDFNFFNQMKKKSIFINVSRGKIVKTKDLLINNIYKKFKGIGLDVTHPEPLDKNNILKKAPNIFITPHVAGPSDYNRLRGFELVKENILRYLKGDNLLNVVDKHKGY